ncbi:SET domain-containing protein-lysine N-methyltransferase [Piscirickettsia litoralis]|uniref:SET domain-containing protein n=1 Tax=Piscirickettsia litoralis TaxID=1891921 RepID=A0ABX3A445_9GAMM|nr:SET domain-containing protein [Piscirickettsia litoralis]ODN43290.1 hypothetical protein BGC07_10615 [Piscirickettsia litoralis]
MNSYKKIADICDMWLVPENGYVEIKTSEVHGCGLFSKTLIEKGSNLGPVLFLTSFVNSIYGKHLVSDHSDSFKDIAKSKDYRQISGARYANHSVDGNVALLFPEPNGTIEMIAIKNINPGDEIVGDYRPFYHFVSAKIPSYLE